MNHILNLSDSELQLINIIQVIKIKLKEFSNKLKKFKVETIISDRVYIYIKKK